VTGYSSLMGLFLTLLFTAVPHRGVFLAKYIQTEINWINGAGSAVEQNSRANH